MSAQAKFDPFVSVVVPSYNSARWVIEAVESVLSQDHAKLEVIVVDDGSADDTEKTLEPWLDRIRYVRQKNGGVSNARNRGIREARGDLIAFLDADDLWLDGKLAMQLACLQSNPEAHLVHTDTIELYEKTGERVHLVRDRKRFSGHCFEHFFWGNRVQTSSVLVTRQCLERVGGFDEAIRHPSTEDLDLWLRIAREYSLAYVDKPLVVYRYHDSNGSLDQRRMIENEYYVLRKALKHDGGHVRLHGDLRRRISRLALHAGYANVDTGDLRRAREFFAQSIMSHPLSPYTWALWASTFLSTPLWRSVRNVKQAATQLLADP